MAAPKAVLGFPNLPAILGALHRYEVSIYSQGHNWVVLTIFLPSNVASFAIRIAEEERTGSLEFGGRLSVHAPPSESPGRPLRQIRQSASLLIFTSTLGEEEVGRKRNRSRIFYFDLAFA
jgi:hypothetical protein